MTKVPGLPFDPFALARATGESLAGLAARPTDLLDVQLAAAKQWGDYWSSLMTPGEKVRDRRFASPEWQDEPYFRAVRDAYLLASEQLRGAIGQFGGDGPNAAMARVLLDQFINAVSPTNFVATNPAVIARVKETGGQNLVNGFKHLIDDIASGKGIVKRRADPNTFVKGKTIAATPGEVVFQNELFQLIQYTPTTAKVAAEPLLYVPPLVNRFYMIDLVPRSSFIKWLVEQGQTVFVVSWVNPTAEHRDKGVEDYVVDGVVTAIEQVRKRTGKAPDLFAFCLGGTLVAIALAWLAANGRGSEANSATMIGTLVDFSDMRDWSAFVHEGPLTMLEDRLERQGYIDSTELQRLFAAMRANDLIWSSVVQHYLLDQPAPPSDLLYWFEDGARIPAAFMTSYNRQLLMENKLCEPAGFTVRGDPIDLASITTPLLVIALKEDHVSAWDAVYRGAGLLAADFLLGGSGHNAGVVNPPAANKHGFWTNKARPASADAWLDGATRHEGSWWPHWIGWLGTHRTGKQVAARGIDDGIEPAPGSYAKAD
ncbi:MAG: class I poly(R)-hydroxyalkanoic acid synthase [Sphingomicrobium sp.]